MLFTSEILVQPKAKLNTRRKSPKSKNDLPNMGDISGLRMGSVCSVGSGCWNFDGIFLTIFFLC